jgi:inosine-uridine nucleoside N-ribohydrolase
MAVTSMPTPVLIDTDMGVDDAVAIALAMASDTIDLVGLTSVGGNVSLEQATKNIGRFLNALGANGRIPAAKGLDQTDAALEDASHVFAKDGFGGIKLPAPKRFKTEDYVGLYERLIAEYGRSLVIVAIGPLTNLAKLVEDRPELLAQAGRIVVMGGAVWCKGNVTPHAEFNFYRDPAAANRILKSGLDVTLVPLDVTRQIAMDESHTAHLSASGTPAGDLLARMIEYPMQREGGLGRGTFLVHDALAIGVIIWPEMFLRSKVALDVVLEGELAGKCKPAVTKDKSRKIAVVISVKVGDFLENMLELLCNEKFVV